MALADQVIHGLECGILLFEEHAAIRRLAHFTVNDHQRRFHGVHQFDDRFFAHVARVKHDGVALAIGQHLHRLLFLFRRVVTVGDDQLFPVGFSLPRRLLEKAAKVKAVEGRDDQTNAVAGLVSQRACEKVRPIAQLFHRSKHLLTRTLFYLTCAVQHARYRGLRHARAQ